MGRVQLVLALHNHQPVGNFDAVVHEACARAYLPFLKLAAQFPALKFGLHTSGCLLEWLERNNPEYLELVRQLVARGQIEVLGGGMYEPILPVLPERDAHWQLTRMTEYVAELFGAAPTGMWCPERVWEPQLPAIIARAGLRYTLLDDFHFRSAAPAEQIETQYFQTAHAGHAISLLPISQKLRYSMPFQPVEQTMDYLRSLAERSSDTPLVVFGDDGEKFGNWPDTYEWVYEQGWLAELFTALTEAQDWLAIDLPAAAIASRPPAGNVYLPALSYAEMGEWTRLDPDAALSDPPGHWRNFLAKYPESAQLLDRAVHNSSCLAQADGSLLAAPARETIAVELGKSECNCAYWHGVFGGIYLNYLRHAVHTHAIRAEAKLHAALLGTQTAIVPYPCGAELTTQWLAANADLALLADTRHGLCITRLDSRPTAYCWTNVLTRRREHYHRKLAAADGNAPSADHASIHDRVVAKQSGLAELLQFDAHQRVSFNVRAHSGFTGEDADPEDFRNQLVASSTSEDWSSVADDVQLLPDALAASVKCGPATLAKSIRLLDNAVHLELGIDAAEAGQVPPYISVEFNLTLLADDAPDRWLSVAGERLPVNLPFLKRQAGSISLCDAWQARQLTLTADYAAILCYPVYTASSSEGGFEKTYQGTCVLLCFDNVSAGRKIDIMLRVEELGDGQSD